MIRIFACALCMCIFFVSCDNDPETEANVEPPRPARAYVLSHSASHTNVAVYNYPQKQLTADRYNRSGQDDIMSANKNGQNLYINTVSPATLRMIDLNSGMELASVQTWANTDQYIAFHGKDVILCSVHEVKACVRIYDEDLMLKDSIAFDASHLNAITTIDDRLFISTTTTNHYIEIFDLTNRKFVHSYQLESACLRLIPMSDDELLCIQGHQYFKLFNASDWQHSMSYPVSVDISTSNVAFDSLDQKLFFIKPVPQPSQYASGIYAFDLRAGGVSLIGDLSETPLTSLAYDTKSGLLFTGPGIRTLSNKGELLDVIATSSETRYIFVE